MRCRSPQVCNIYSPLLHLFLPSTPIPGTELGQLINVKRSQKYTTTERQLCNILNRSMNDCIPSCKTLEIFRLCRPRKLQSRCDFRRHCRGAESAHLLVGGKIKPSIIISIFCLVLLSGD